MKIQDQVTPFSQSVTLGELGLKGIPNAQYCWVDFSTNSGHEFALCRPLLFGNNSWLIVQDNISAEMQSQLDNESLNAGGPIYAAYTVAELGEIMKEIDNGNIDAHSFYNWHMGFWDGIISKIGGEDQELINSNFECDTEAEVRADMLIWLIENKHVDVEYCNTIIDVPNAERSVAPDAS